MARSAPYKPPQKRASTMAATSSTTHAQRERVRIDTGGDHPVLPPSPSRLESRAVSVSASARRAVGEVPGQ
jgi:hypothetical protein